VKAADLLEKGGPPRIYGAVRHSSTRAAALDATLSVPVSTAGEFPRPACRSVACLATEHDETGLQLANHLGPDGLSERRSILASASYDRRGP